MWSRAHGINPAVYLKAKYDPVKSFVPITLVGAAPQVLVAHPSFPANSLKELLAMPPEQRQKIAVGTPFDAAFLDAMPQGSVEMARFLDEEVRQWKAVAVQTGISLD